MPFSLIFLAMHRIVRVAAGAAPPVQPKMSGQKLLCSTCTTLCWYFEFFLVIRDTYGRLSLVFVNLSRAGSRL